MAFSTPHPPSSAQGGPPIRQSQKKPIDIKSSYADDGTLNTNMSREPIDLGPLPDFDADLGKFQSMVKRRPDAGDQAAALAPRSGGGAGTMAPGPSRQVVPERGIDTFGSQVGGGPQTSGIAYMPWKPGDPINPLKPPVYTGSY